MKTFETSFLPFLSGFCQWHWLAAQLAEKQAPQF
jgi:hypothetical protein